MSRLSELRKNSKLSYQTMADFLGVSKTFYWQIENGNRRLSYIMAVKIADIFKLRPDDIFYDEIKDKEEVILQ